MEVSLLTVFNMFHCCMDPEYSDTLPCKVENTCPRPELPLRQYLPNDQSILFQSNETSRYLYAPLFI